MAVVVAHGGIGEECLPLEVNVMGYGPFFIFRNTLLEQPAFSRSVVPVKLVKPAQIIHPFFFFSFLRFASWSICVLFLCTSV